MNPMKAQLLDAIQKKLTFTVPGKPKYIFQNGQPVIEMRCVEGL
jgi:hypothetical protein